MCKYNLSKIRSEIREYNLKQILKSGENNMIDEHVNRNLVEELLSEKTEKNEQKTPVIDLSKNLNDIEESKLYESIINLKNK